MNQNTLFATLSDGSMPRLSAVGISDLQAGEDVKLPSRFQNFRPC